MGSELAGSGFLLPFLPIKLFKTKLLDDPKICARDKCVPNIDFSFYFYQQSCGSASWTAATARRRHCPRCKFYYNSSRRSRILFNTIGAFWPTSKNGTAFINDTLAEKLWNRTETEDFRATENPLEKFRRLKECRRIYVYRSLDLFSFRARERILFWLELKKQQVKLITQLSALLHTLGSTFCLHNLV